MGDQPPANYPKVIGYAMRKGCPQEKQRTRGKICIWPRPFDVPSEDTSGKLRAQDRSLQHLPISVRGGNNLIDAAFIEGVYPKQK